MARYSSRTGRWYGQKRSNVTLPETDRDERQWQTQLPGGLVLTEYGAPIPRHPTEPQPVHVGGSIKGSSEVAPKAPPSEPPASVPSPSREALTRDHRAITREP
jgi:hypothetical protein